MGIFDRVEEFLYEKKVKQFQEETSKFFANMEKLNDMQIKENKQKIIEKYEDVLHDKSFINASLDVGSWQYLEFLNDEDRKKTFYDFAYHKVAIDESALSYWDRIDGITEGRFVYTGDEAYKYLPKSIIEDKDEIIGISKYYPKILDYVPSYIKEDRKFLKEYTLSNNISKFEDIPIELRDDKEFLTTLAIKNSYIVRTYPSEIIDDKLISTMKENDKELTYHDFPQDHPIRNDANFVLSFFDDKVKSRRESYQDSFSCVEEIFNYKTSSLFEDNKEILLGFIERGYIESYTKAGNELKKDPEVLKTVIQKFKEYDVSLDYDVERIAQYPSKLTETLESIDFNKERRLLREKVQLNENDKKVSLEL